MLKVHWSEAKEKFEALMDAAVKGETVIIIGENEQTIRLTVEERKPEIFADRVPGSARGFITLSDDFDDPLPDFADYS